MRIRTQFIITMVFFGLLLLIMAASAVITNQRLEKAGQQEKIAANIARGASELGYLANDYLIYRESQQMKRWHSRFDSFSAEVADLRAERPEQQALVANIQANQKRLKEVFDSVASGSELSSRTMGAALAPVSLQVSWSRMAVQSQGLVSDASRLSHMLHQQMDELTATRAILMYVTLALFGVFLLASYMLTYRRILKSIATLRAGTAVIGSGNLDFRIDEKRDDEVGDLSRAFNRMTSDLKTVTASRGDLEREVAERKRAEERLSRQREWLEVTLTSIGDAVIATDTESKISFLNPVAAALTGWPIEEALGQPVQDLFRIINEKTRKQAEDVVGRVLSEEGNVTLANHTALVTRDGREVPIEDSAAPIKDASGKVAGVVLVFHDVTEKRRAVQALRRSAQFPEENPNPVLRIAAGGALLYANEPARNCLATFGWQADGLLSAPVRAVVAHARGQEHAIPTEISNPAGSTFWIFAVQPPGEDYVNLYGIDITKRKRAEEALEKAHAQLQDHALRLQETNRELEGFAYTISHDLRAPLRAINGFAHMLADDYGPSLDEEGKRRLAVIEANAIKMGMLIDDLLAFSRAGRTTVNVSRIDMNSLVADLVETLKTSEAGAKAAIHVVTLPPAQGDPSLVRQVLANLLENAVKFSRKRPDPGIEVGSFERSGEEVYFVKDNGVGFDLKYHDKVFGVFQRLVTEKEFEGTGVGLAIVQRLIARHGGRVWAEARPGEGATFFFTLRQNEREQA